MPGYDKSRIIGISEKDLNEFTCGICQDIFNNPVVTQCCRQTFCKECIEEWLTTQNTCPNDRKLLRSIDLIPAPRLVWNLLNNMQIKCDFEGKGCGVITSIGHLSKHVINCFYKLENNCKVCNLVNDQVNGKEHNCVASLISQNNDILYEMDKLSIEIQSLRKLTTNTNMDITAILDSARNCLNDFFIEEPTYMISSAQQQFLIDTCKEVILNNNSFYAICQNLHQEINRSQICQGSKWWQVVAFTLGNAESAAICDQFFRIRFGNLVIKFFTSRDCTRVNE